MPWAHRVQLETLELKEVFKGILEDKEPKVLLDMLEPQVKYLGHKEPLVHKDLKELKVRKALSKDT